MAIHQKISIGAMFFLAAILEVSFFPKILPRAIAADLVLVIFVILFSEERFEKKWSWAIVAGLISDVASFSLIGLSSLFFLAVALVAEFLFRKSMIFRKNENCWIILAFIAISSGIYYLVEGFFSPIQAFSLAELFFRIFNTFLVALIIFWPLSKMKNFFQIKERSLLLR